MAWKARGGRAYLYRSERVGGRVVSRYVGNGIAAESAGLFRQAENLDRESDAADRAEARDEIRRMEAADREADSAHRDAMRLAGLAVEAAGYYRHNRGAWRRMAMAKDAATRSEREAELAGQLEEILLKAREGDAKSEAAVREMEAAAPGVFRQADLAERAAGAVVARATSDAATAEIMRRRIGQLRDELAGPDPTPIELALAERAALSWADSYVSDAALANKLRDGGTLPGLDLVSRLAERAGRRYVASLRALADVKRLAVPVLNLAEIRARLAAGRGDPPRLAVAPSGPHGATA